MSASSNPMSDRALDSRNSRLSLQDQLIKTQRADLASGYLHLPQFEKLKNAKLFSTASNCSINTDDESNTSSDFDLYNKIKLRSPSISADSLNQSQLSLTDCSPRTRLPLSNDSLFKFSMEDEQNANDKLDHYLDKLETSDLLFSKQQSTWMTESFRNLSTGQSAVTLEDAASLHYENINLLTKKQQEKAQISATSSSTIYYDSLEDVSNKNSITPSPDVQPLKEQNLSLHDALHQDDIQNRNYSMTDQADEASTIFEMTHPSHSRNNSNLSDSAPYYYSDLTGAEAAQAATMQQKLNNQQQQQRDLPMARKIPHIHNLIGNNSVSGNTTAPSTEQLTSILKDQAEKEQAIDRKNIYESGIGRLPKLVNKDEPTVASLSQKIYYHEKNTNVDGGALTASSIDNLLYAMPPQQSITDDDTSLNNETSLDTSSTNVDCDQLWEEDAIWCESLRRVSQRHARSLDDLDRIASISSAATKAAKINDADREWGVASTATTLTSTSSVERKSRAKITRDVTYVNEEHQRNLTIKKKKNVEPPKLDDNDVYVQLACTPQQQQQQPSTMDVYETLRSDDNIDRENIRQWDMMSSGLVKSSSSVNSKVSKVSFIGSSSMDAGSSHDSGETMRLKGKFTKSSNNRQSN